MSIIQQIKAHEQELFSKKIPSDLKTCPNCKETPDYFQLHYCKKRLFLVIVEGSVQKIWSFLGRWKCSLCGRSFIYYPDFAIPYKRYVKNNIIELAQLYVENDKVTYQEAVTNNGLAIGYDSEADLIDERQLVGSTVWRWLAWIGSLNHVVSKGLDIIRQKLPSSEIFRQIHPIHPKKYRSNERRKLLSQSLILFMAEKILKNLSNWSIFPHFAIRYG